MNISTNFSPSQLLFFVNVKRIFVNYSQNTVYFFVEIVKINQNLLIFFKKYIIIVPLMSYEFFSGQMNKTKEHKMQPSKKFLAFILTAATLLTCIPFISVSASEYDTYYQSLLDSGFPESYAVKLAKLHFIHPNWEFEAADITGMSYQHYGINYTWNYVISQELDPEDTNLVSKSTGSAYLKNYTEYDSGWYPANRAAVEYAMDPRNFLDERHIFMFLTLYKDTTTYSAADIESALAGTFMANTVIPDSGNTLTYAQYFLQLGNTYNINPIFIAARLRQEQGVAGSSPLISGKCGTELYNSYLNGTNDAPSSGYDSTLLQYDGYYNYFNIGAYGDGYFNIWLGGMKEAKTAGWNTRMKAIEGGVKKLRDVYLATYRHTLYYQKFNVDARSKYSNGSSMNFEAQYMQNLMAPYSEGRTMQYALQTNLDAKYKFIIPVYSSMPEYTTDPGTYFSGEKYSYLASVDAPTSHSSGGSTPVIMSHTVDLSESSQLYISGWSVTTKLVTGFSYSIDGSTTWTKLTSKYRSDITSSTSSAGYPTHSVNAYSGTIDLSSLPIGTHTIVIKGTTGVLSTKTGTQAYPVAVIDLTVTSSDLATIPVSSTSGYSYETYQGQNVLFGIKPGTTVSELLSNIDVDTCSVYSASGNKMSSSDTVASGCFIKRYKNDVCVVTALISVMGDFDGNGTVNGIDVLRIKKMINGISISGYNFAADFDKNGTVTQTDLENITANNF